MQTRDEGSRAGTSLLSLHHRVDRPDLGLGLVRAEGIEVGPAPSGLAGALGSLLGERRAAPLSATEEALRRGSREMLRNGRYRPTGRGKPASEYLLRAAAEDGFPRINGPVDANNLVSLQHCVPISVWDLDLAGSTAVKLRLGSPDERYVFNPSGQVLELADLVCGCALFPDGRSSPVVSPVKDSMATKIRPGTTRVGGCIYYPLGAGSEANLARATEELLGWLLSCGRQARGAWAVALPGQTVTL